jgi:hypothetical protein
MICPASCHMRPVSLAIVSELPSGASLDVVMLSCPLFTQLQFVSRKTAIE